MQEVFGVVLCQILATGLWYAALVLTWVFYCVIVALINQMSHINVGFLKIPFPGRVIWYFSVVVAILLEWLFAVVLKENKQAAA
ncbi:MAG: hypothetical protein ABSF77_13435 [Spirochaetia bacterium]